jgi:hypothetical protein
MSERMGGLLEWDAVDVRLYVARRPAVLRERLLAET